MFKELLQEPIGIFSIIIAVILIAPMLSRQARLPGIVGLVLGGVIVGPHGLGLLERDGPIELLATVGLVYLMFNAGAEIDLTQFKRVRNQAITFGIAAFALPQLLGMGLGLGLGYSLAAAILLGSMFASHTLVSFPLIERLGITHNQSVSVTIGATIITDIAALLVLAAVAGLHDSDQATGVFLARLVMFLLIYTAVMLTVVPRLGRMFFNRFHIERVEFQFVLVVIFVSALAAEFIGMEAIVGAFLAGLAINSTVDPKSVLMQRVIFMGQALFIPIFLMSIGLLIDPLAFFTDRRTLMISVLLVGGVFSAKYAASWLMARLFGYSFSETMLMWGLSVAQAAATLAVTLIGREMGLFDDAIFNAVIITILITCVASPLIVQHYGEHQRPQFQKEAPSAEPDNLEAPPD